MARSDYEAARRMESGSALYGLLLRTRRLRAAALGTFLVLQITSTLPAAEATDSRLKKWAEEQKARCENARAEYRKRELEIQKARARAQSVFQAAEKQKDFQAAYVAREAGRKAELAMDRVETLQRINEARLHAVNRLLERLREGHAWTSNNAAGAPPAPGSREQLAVAGLMKGQVFRNSPGGSMPFSGDAPLSEGDELQTGPGGFAELLFYEGSVVQMGPDTAFGVLKLGQENSLFDLARGRLHAEFKCLQKGRQPCRMIRLRRGTGASVAVRGTEIEIDAPDGQPARVTVLSGMVEVTAPDSDKTVGVKAGEAVTVSPEGALQGPAPAEVKSVRRWWEESK